MVVVVATALPKSITLLPCNSSIVSNSLFPLLADEKVFTAGVPDVAADASDADADDNGKINRLLAWLLLLVLLLVLLLSSLSILFNLLPGIGLTKDKKAEEEGMEKAFSSLLL